MGLLQEKPNRVPRFLVAIFFLLLFITIALIILLIWSERQMNVGLQQDSPSFADNSYSRNDSSYSKKEIKLSSYVDGYQLKIKDREKLNEFLNEIGFWDKSGVSDFRQSENVITAQSLEISLVSDVDGSWWRQVSQEDEMVAAVGTSINDQSEVEISISIWEKELADSERRNQRLGGLLIRGLYGLSPRIRSLATDPSNISESTKEAYQEYKNYSDVLTIENE